MSTVRADNVSPSAGGTSRNLPRGVAAAWINFNGTTPAIKDSQNISSLTDNGAGDFTQNHTAALSSANYFVGMSCLNLGTNNHDMIVHIAGTYTTGATLKSASQLRVLTGTITSAGNADNADTSVDVLGSLA